MFTLLRAKRADFIVGNKTIQLTIYFNVFALNRK